jgi:Uma2 family endonuclease
VDSSGPPAVRWDMASAAQLLDPGPDPGPREDRVLLAHVPWATYVVLRDTVPSAAVRMTYLEGWLEIMRPSRRHEVSKKLVARFLELFCLERDIPLCGYGSTTFRKEEAQRGLEPDECYARGADKDIPDLALEVVVSKDALDKLEVYRGLGIGEVWRFEAGVFTVHLLKAGAYHEHPTSLVFPELDLVELAQLVAQPDQHEALKAYRARLRGA